jgi:hypothetical protein
LGEGDVAFPGIVAVFLPDDPDSDQDQQDEEHRSEHQFGRGEPPAEDFPLQWVQDLVVLSLPGQYVPPVARVKIPPKSPGWKVRKRKAGK